jgi:hypothetical protein
MLAFGMATALKSGVFLLAIVLRDSEESERWGVLDILFIYCLFCFNLLVHKIRMRERKKKNVPKKYGFNRYQMFKVKQSHFSFFGNRKSLNVIQPLLCI